MAFWHEGPKGHDGVPTSSESNLFSSRPPSLLKKTIPRCGPVVRGRRESCRIKEMWLKTFVAGDEEKVAVLKRCGLRLSWL